MTEEQTNQEVQQSKKQKGSAGIFCVICEEKKGDYTKDSKPVCSGCLNTKANLTEQFFNFTLSDMISSIEYHGFHPSPLTLPETTE